jgi:Flp pilus assembly protein TadG
MRRKTEKRRGVIAVVVALLLTTLLGVVALAVDGGMLLNYRRRVSAAADAAALAAADDLFAKYTTNNGSDPNGTAKASALSTAVANGFSNGVNSTVTVNIPPASGNFVNQAGYAEVIIQYNQKRGFSGLFGSGNMPVTSRAVASGKVGTYGIVMLDYIQKTAAQIMGKVNILDGGAIYINSSATETNPEFSYAGSVYLGSGAALSTGGLYLNGTSLLTNAGGTITYTNGGSVSAFSPQITDPLANIAEPTVTGTTYGTGSTGYSVTTTSTLQPGIYPGGIQIGSGSGSSTIAVTLASGIYFLGTGTGSGSGSTGFTIASGATVTGTGVMFYNQLGDNISPFSGSVNITPPTSGTYWGISFWQPRADAMEIHISGSANVTMPGTWYNVGTSYQTGENGGNATTGEFDINPAAGATYNIGSYIADQAEWQQGVGASGGTININPGGGAPTQRPTLVE